MADFIPVPIVDDNPARQGQVAFGFETYARTLAEIIAAGADRTPLVIGVHGPWGSGKTTLMRAVAHELSVLAQEDRPGFRRCKSVWFQAWKHAGEDAILAALIEEILRTMKGDGFFEGCKPEIEKLVARFNVGKFIGKAAEKFTGIDVSRFFDDLPHKGRLGFYESFQKFFDRLIWSYLNWRPQLCGSEETDPTSRFWSGPSAATRGGSSACSTTWPCCARPSETARSTSPTGTSSSGTSSTTSTRPCGRT